MKTLMFLIIACAPIWALAGYLGTAQQRKGSPQPRIYNTVKQKLMEGKQVIAGTVASPDPNMYRAMANAGFDCLWIEMQHSPLNYQDVATMIWAAKGSPAIPFIRVPDATAPLRCTSRQESPIRARTSTALRSTWPFRGSR
jgi:hypothetical protein